MLDAHERKREVGCTQKAFDLIRRVSGKTVRKMNDLRVQEEQSICQTHKITNGKNGTKPTNIGRK